jgi:MFS family permease
MLTQKDSSFNFYALLWHALLLSLSQSFIDFDVVLPAMIIDAGGTSMHVGILTAIMLGGASITQLFFAPYISNKPFKKRFLLLGINSRIFSLGFIAFLLYYISQNKEAELLWLIFIVISLYAVGGAFASLSYNDIIGKSLNEHSRKSFFSVKQIIIGIGVFISAYFAKKILTFYQYPFSYMTLFIIGFVLLATSSMAFWLIREKVESNLKIDNLKHFFSIMKIEIAENKKLRNYLGFVNTQGIAVSFLPFVILYSKQFLTGNTAVGNFLLFKVIGAVSAGILISLLIKKIKYRFLLYLGVIVSLSIVFILIMFHNSYAFYTVFVLGGIIASIYSITMNGVLLEVSSKDNRALYTGISGAGYILPAIFPILGGFIIKEFNFTTFFLLYAIIVLSSLFFIRKIDCKK